MDSATRGRRDKGLLFIGLADSVAISVSNYNLSLKSLRKIRKKTFNPMPCALRAIHNRRSRRPDQAAAVHPHAMRSPGDGPARNARSEEHTSELQSRLHLVCRLLLEK